MLVSFTKKITAMRGFVHNPDSTDISKHTNPSTVGRVFIAQSVQRKKTSVTTPSAHFGGLAKSDSLKTTTVTVTTLFPAFLPHEPQPTGE